MATEGVEKVTPFPSQNVKDPLIVITGLLGVGFNETALVVVDPHELDVTSRNSKFVPAVLLSENSFNVLDVKSP